MSFKVARQQLRQIDVSDEYRPQCLAPALDKVEHNTFFKLDFNQNKKKPLSFPSLFFLRGLP